jgi:hypothetical protein
MNEIKSTARKISQKNNSTKNSSQSSKLKASSSSSQIQIPLQIPSLPVDLETINTRIIERRGLCRRFQRPEKHFLDCFAVERIVK